jgi:hypothetical protein
MIQFGYNTYVNNETPCIAILNKQRCLFSKMENRKVKQVLPRVGTSGRE